MASALIFAGQALLEKLGKSEPIQGVIESIEQATEIEFPRRIDYQKSWKPSWEWVPDNWEELADAELADEFQRLDRGEQ